MTTTSLNLDAIADSLETHNTSHCSLCTFIGQQPDDHQREIDALLASPRKTETVFKVLRQIGFRAMTSGPVAGHRKNGHRA